MTTPPGGVRRASGTLAGLDRLSDRAEALAGAWSARARGSTSHGVERAILRLLGVDGLSRDGLPLAAEVVDRFALGRPDRLAGGICLPFTVALLEYDLAPQGLALEVAAGTVDLGVEADVLQVPDRRAAAEVESRRLADAALDRIDGDRTARRELASVLGEPPSPWLATSLSEAVVDDALVEAGRFVRAGFDAVRVDVPAGRELTMLMAAEGQEVAAWHPPGEPPGDPLGPRPADRSDRAPTGSQRGIARLRQALDELAAARQDYVRLAIAAPPLAQPEAAVVAAVERVDAVVVDPMAEIVGGADPDRVLADHAFAVRLLRRAGTLVLVGGGPLVVAPDLEAGMPSSAATWSGRALALQLLAVAVTRAGGLPAGQILVGAVPAWLDVDTPAGAARALAEVELRRALFGEYRLWLEEPGGPEPAPTWPFLVAGISPGEVGLVMRRAPAGGVGRFARHGRAAVAVAAGLAGARGPVELAGAAADHAREAIRVAEATLDQLAGRGWRAIVGDAPGSGGRRGLGADGVAERTDAFDPFDAA